MTVIVPVTCEAVRVLTVEASVRTGIIPVYLEVASVRTEVLSVFMEMLPRHTVGGKVRQ